MMSMRDHMTAYISHLQQQIISELESILGPEGPKFKTERWTRPEGGYGKSAVIQSSSSLLAVLEKAGVNISVIHGTLPPAAIKQMSQEHSEISDSPDLSLPFFAAGLSLVIHPSNPHAPTVNANFRYFEITSSVDSTEPISWWFGSVLNVTPSYLYPEDCIHFHKTLKEACDAHSSDFYPAFKKRCDDYFWIPHRNEARGVGGISFDDLNSFPHKSLPPYSTRPTTPMGIFSLIQSLGNAFVPSYLPILRRRTSTPYTEDQRRWQLLRRGRYVEFNLVVDRGTKFGLNAPGVNVENVLMTLPETARWEYASDMGQDGTEEGRLMEVLRYPRDWV